jgi:hypothetical protein
MLPKQLLCKQTWSNVTLVAIVYKIIHTKHLLHWSTRTTCQSSWGKETIRNPSSINNKLHTGSLTEAAGSSISGSWSKIDGGDHDLKKRRMSPLGAWSGGVDALWRVRGWIRVGGPSSRWQLVQRPPAIATWRATATPPRLLSLCFFWVYAAINASMFQCRKSGREVEGALDRTVQHD